MAERLAAPSTVREVARRLPAPIRLAVLRAARLDPRRELEHRAVVRFVERHSEDVRGSVLEYGSAALTRRVGGARVSRSEVLDARPGNLGATIVADPAEPGSLPEGAFDCVLLNGLPDPVAALPSARAALAPGGVLLATAPAGEAGGVPAEAEVGAIGGRLIGIRLARRDG